MYLFVLGSGIGLCMQVLVLVVQNTASFADLGVATSGVTFFRTIGSSFGAAIFGSLFANFLAGRIGPALAAGGAPPRGGASRRRRCTRCRRRWRRRSSTPTPTRSARCSCARSPVAVIGFVVALFLKEVPLREMDAVSATDLGEGFGMPTHRVAGEDPRDGDRPADPRLARDPAAQHRRAGRAANSTSRMLWALMQIYRQSQVFGSARLTDIAERLRVPREVLEPTFDRLVDAATRCAPATSSG